MMGRVIMVRREVRRRVCSDGQPLLMITALPLLVLLLCLVLGVPIAIALAASGMFGIYVVTGDLTKVLGIVGLAPFSRSRTTRSPPSRCSS